MDAMPLICPACGELVIAAPEMNRLVIPAHPDRIEPFETCTSRVVTFSDRAR